VVEAYANEALERGEKTVEYAHGEFPKKVYSTRFGA
jgi:hypothetical protein